MPVIYSPDQLPCGTRYVMDAFMGYGGRYVDIFRSASPGSVCIAIVDDFAACCRHALRNKAAVVTTNILAGYGSRDLLGGGTVPLYIIPVPDKYHALYFNLFPYLRSRAQLVGRQLVLPSAFVEALMEQLGALWRRDSGYLRSHQLSFHQEFIKANLHKVEAIYKRLANQVSKDAFMRYVYADPFMQFEYAIANLLSKIQYFDYLVPPSGGVVINCGVDNGWELPFFLSSMGINASIINIDPTGSSHLSSYAALFCNHPVSQGILSFHTLAVWDSSVALVFNNNTVRIQEAGDEREGDVTVQATTIDALTEQLQLQRVDIIKMDLEGAEPKALRGMMETVKRFRPQLAVCIYHSKEQSLDIPYQLMATLDAYNFYFDTYFVDTGESVFYAIPQEIDTREPLPIVLEPVLTDL